MKHIATIIALVLSISISQFAFGDPEKRSKAKGKQAAEHRMLKQESAWQEQRQAESH